MKLCDCWGCRYLVPAQQSLLRDLQAYFDGAMLTEGDLIDLTERIDELIQGKVRGLAVHADSR